MIKPILPLTPSPQKLEKPLIDFVKVNADAVLVDNKTRIQRGHMSTEWAELFALIEGITLARSFNFDKVIFESDCANLVNRFQKHREDITILGHRIKEVRGMLELFPEANVQWNGHDRNKVVDILCRLALNNHCKLSFAMKYPNDIHNCIVLDSC
ncbi:hypothetical protein CXB51_024459 [Gossypium anomalum]|uniref:RNase H type-1 domain-containing protein n=1 Tax=Gossypium anomalum TaxID=47600 RepID=A0A8J6CWE8_9ROSI|nr:hypothetical protein CXB51_024459 [Gossypium anomalum]